MLTDSRIRRLVKWELKKTFYKKINKGDKLMATINFSEEDLLQAEKKKKKEEESNQQRIKDKVNENWNKIFNSSSNIDTNKVNNNDSTLKSTNNTVNATNNAKNEQLTTQNKQVNSENMQLSVDNKVNNNDTNNDNLNKVNQNNQVNSTLKTTNLANKTPYQELQDKINEIASKYDVEPKKGEEISTDLNLTKKDYITKSDDELKQEAENSLNDYKKAELDSINSKLETGLASLDGKEEELKTSAEEQKSQLQSYYDNAKKQAENDALKRGLQRSSIVINNLNAFDNEKIAKLMEIDSQLNSEINELNDQITQLNAEKEKAIQDFNIEYALKVNDKIAELQQEIQDRNDEITEYNNKIAQIEAEYKQSSTESNNELRNDYLDNLIEYGENKGTILSMRDDAYAKAIDEYLNTLSKEDALSELKNNSYIRDLLGTNYAYYLYKTQQRQ